MIDHQLIKDAILIRMVEEKLLQLFSQGKISGTIHTCVGQEFSAIAFTRSFKSGDFIFSNHRCHGHYLSRTKNYQGLIAELLGKKTGVCGGIGSSQHLCSHNFFSNGIQGGMVPVSAGVALAQKLKSTKNIASVYIGDGTLGQGAVYETMNIASRWGLPLLIICENNYYAQYTSQSINLAGDILKRAEAFGLATYKSNVWDTDHLLKNAAASIDYVREKSLPVFHMVECYRLNPHSKGDDHRDPQEINKYKILDPLNTFAAEHPGTYGEFLRQAEEIINPAIEEQLKDVSLSFDDYYTAVVNPGHGGFQEIPEIDIRQVELINDFFDKTMEKDRSVVFMGEDVLSPPGGTFKVSQGLSHKYPDRIISTPISENSLTGVANGLALAGFRPFLEIMFGDFMTLCMDQIINHASKFHHMYNKQITCPVVIRTPMGGRRGYGPTHSQTLDKFLVGIDNVTTLALNSLIDPRLIYNSILTKEKHPVIVLENKSDYAKKIGKRKIKYYKYEQTIADYPIARIRPVSSKPNATIVTYGGMVDVVLDAIEPLFLELEIKAEVLVISKIHPMDYTEILESVAETKKLYVIEEGSYFAGIGSEIIASVVEKMEEKIITQRIAALPVPIPSPKELENLVLPSVESIKTRIKESLR